MMMGGGGEVKRSGFTPGLIQANESRETPSPLLTAFSPGFCLWTSTM